MTPLSHIAWRNVPAQSLEEFDIEFSYPLGAGAVGTVYPGQHRASTREVAIKVCSSVLTDRTNLQQAISEEELGDCIVQESQAFTQMIEAGVSHPHVVDCVSCFEGSAEEAVTLGLPLPDSAMDGPLHYFVMERLSGTSLDDIIEKRGVMDEEEASMITRAMCEGLECLHQNGIVHRDIKPGNVMLPHTANPADVKLIDFSHAGVMPEGSLEGASEQLVFTKKLGTPGYVAPEVLKNKDPYSAKCDVFSLGCTVHAMLSNGRVPRRHPRAGIVTSLPQSVSTEGRDWVDALLAFCPEDRPTIGEALAKPWLQQCH